MIGNGIYFQKLHRTLTFRAIFKNRILKTSLASLTLLALGFRSASSAGGVPMSPASRPSPSEKWQEIHSTQFENLPTALESGANVYVCKIKEVLPVGQKDDNGFGDIGHLKMEVLNVVKGEPKHMLLVPYSGSWSHASLCGGSIEAGWAANKRPEAGQLRLCLVVPNGYDCRLEIPKDAPWEQRRNIRNADDADIDPRLLCLDGENAGIDRKVIDQVDRQSSSTQPTVSMYPTISNADLADWDGAVCIAAPLISDTDSLIDDYRAVAKLFSLKGTQGEATALTEAKTNRRGIVRDYAISRLSDIESSNRNNRE